MYKNIPRKEIINITNNILENNIEIEVSTWKEIIHIMRTIIKQNYFQFDQQYYEQTEGLAMGAPISAILAEIFIQYMEHKYIYQILRTREIVAYYRYVDDILIIYDQHKTNIEQTLEEFNNIQPTIKRTKGKNKLFGHHNTPKKNERLAFSIYRKSTQTSQYLIAHATPTNTNFLLNRIHMYPIMTEAKQTEIHIIKKHTTKK
jgi:hypothetical protein